MCKKKRILSRFDYLLLLAVDYLLCGLIAVYTGQFLCCFFFCDFCPVQYFGGGNKAVYLN